MSRKIEDATNQELASVMNVVSVGKCRHYCKGETVMIDENNSVIDKKDQEFLISVLREASKRLSQMSPEMKRKDLINRISRLGQLSAEIELHLQKLTDNPEESETLEEEYQALFAETIEKFSN